MLEKSETPPGMFRIFCTKTMQIVRKVKNINKKSQ